MTVGLYVIGFGRRDLLAEQKRLIRKYIEDDHRVVLVDNSRLNFRPAMRRTAETVGIDYLEAPVDGLTIYDTVTSHPDALDYAARIAHAAGEEYWGLLDHDIFPAERISLANRIKKAGFYGRAQTAADGRPYLWPGLCFFSREWLAGRIPTFSGDSVGDVGAATRFLVSADDWARLPPLPFTYLPIRKEDEFGTQSWTVEILDGWVHFTNGSRWKYVPDRQHRDQILNRMLANL